MYLPVSTVPYIDVLVYIYLPLSRDSSRACTLGVFISFTYAGAYLRIFPPLVDLLFCWTLFVPPLVVLAIMYDFPLHPFSISLTRTCHLVREVIEYDQREKNRTEARRDCRRQGSSG